MPCKQGRPSPLDPNQPLEVSCASDNGLSSEALFITAAQILLGNIPYATRWVATVQGTVWKVVACSHCGQRYAFQLELETTGQEVGPPLLFSDEGAKLAQARAEENLSKMGRNVVVPAPCPNCGCYQPDMVELLRTEGTSNTPVRAGLIIAALSLIPLAFSLPHAWVATAVGVSIGLGLLGYADWSAARWNPNAGDPEPRKARGRKLAVWGDELDQLLAAGLDSVPAPSARPVGGQAADERMPFVFFESRGPTARLAGGQAAEAEPGTAPDAERI